MAKNKLFRQSKFEFIGELSYGDTPLSTKKLSDTSKWDRTKLGIAVKNDSNSQFLNIEYIHKDDVKKCKLMAKDKDENGNTVMLEVNLSDTSNQEIIDKCADLIKVTIDLESDFEKKSERAKLFFKKLNHERKEEKTEDDLKKIAEYDAQINELSDNRVVFAHMKDVILFLNQALPIIGKQKVRITGNAEVNHYKGKTNFQYVPSLIELVPEETENKLKVYCDFFYDKDGIEDNVKEKKMIVNGYVGKTVSKKDKLFPHQVILDYTKVDEANDMHVLLLKAMKEIFKINDKKQVHKNGLELTVLNGREQVEFNEDCLTEIQKTYVKVGLNKLEDFKPKGNVYGNRIQELRVNKADLKEYPNGSVDVFAVKEIEEYLSQDDSDKSITDIKKEEKSPVIKEETKQTESPQDMMKALFG